MTSNKFYISISQNAKINTPTYPHKPQLSESTSRASSRGLTLQLFTPSPNIVPARSPKSSLESINSSFAFVLMFTSTLKKINRYTSAVEWLGLCFTNLNPVKRSPINKMQFFHQNRLLASDVTSR